jgi:hypothetical protein
VQHAVFYEGGALASNKAVEDRRSEADALVTVNESNICFFVDTILYKSLIK